MPTNSKFTRQQLYEIDAAITEFEVMEAERRKIEANQLRRLASAMEAAVGSAKLTQAARDLAFRSLRMELASTLHEGEHAAERLLQLAYDAHRSFPLALRTLESGTISLNHLRVIAAEGAPLTIGDGALERERRERYEARVLEVAREESPSRLRPIARRLAASEAQASLEENHERAVAKRSIRLVEADDGMADLIAHLPAVEAQAIYDRVARLAKKVSKTAAAGAATGVGTGPMTATGPESASGAAGGSAFRSIDAVRADVFRDLLLGDVDGGGDALGSRRASSGIDGRVQVIIPGRLLTEDHAGAAGATGTSDGTAELVGYGPIPASVAKRIAGEARAWELVTVDEGGKLLSVDRYRPTAAMRRHLAARDLHCRAPGCRVPAHRCEIDHTVAAEDGGPTSIANLSHLCKGHHMLKHHTDWRVRQEEGGVMIWTSPTGRQHRDRPESRVKFRHAE
ncbi:uncharacterized protein DUF222 [Leucobacter komagatae]|uniref:Uncharacterized protein DUF222 n=1 Tax=Leucobacter komagatae TaxID=55969 RepID=A0A542Y3L3_9MICO|nr:HNH endonuclease signature motif containing protein [Leucobacter komagatae]TQL42662.1 uncharacterized protein DUF222 [Leucobacter komagatae]